jgi:hypothetical protein
LGKAFKRLPRFFFRFKFQRHSLQETMESMQLQQAAVKGF